MAFRLFKTFKEGPVRFTVSRSGLSTSIGGKSLRVGRRTGHRKPRYSVKMPGGWRLRKG